jgi:hypothetical protein
MGFSRMVDGKSDPVVTNKSVTKKLSYKSTRVLPSSMMMYDVLQSCCTLSAAATKLSFVQYFVYRSQSLRQDSDHGSCSYKMIYFFSICRCASQPLP